MIACRYSGEARDKGFYPTPPQPLRNIDQHMATPSYLFNRFSFELFRKSTFSYDVLLFQFLTLLNAYWIRGSPFSHEKNACRFSSLLTIHDLPCWEFSAIKMVSFNKDAIGKKGDRRKAFMKECLSAKPEVEVKKLAPQQEKMKTCNADAKDMKGDDLKKFMSTCLKK